MGESEIREGGNKSSKPGRETPADEKLGTGAARRALSLSVPEC